MRYVILDPDQQQAQLLDSTDGHDLAGRTVLDVDDGFAWSVSAVDWSTLTIVPNTARALADLRARRDTLMFATDPTQLADKDETYRAAWQAYRQALKDLPETVEDPFNPEWPTPPDEDELTKLGSAFMAARATLLTL